MKTFLLTLMLCGTAAAQTTLTIDTAINLPDATGGPTGEGFTCTGIARHSNGTDWWVMNYGVEDPADVTFSSNVVHLSADFSTNLGELDLSAFGSASMQGVALDTSDNTLWLCIGPNIRNYSEAGVYQSKIISPTGGANGVAYDAANDRLYCMTAAGAFTVYNAADQTLVDTLTSCPATGPDHLCMAPDGVKVWCAAGTNGADGTVWEYTPGTDSWAQIFTLDGADATEGIVVDGDYIRLANDAYFHSGTPPDNRILTFRFQTSGTITATTLNITNLTVGP